MAQAPPGPGERFAFRRTNGPETWAVRSDGEAVRLGYRSWPRGGLTARADGTWGPCAADVAREG